MTALLTIPEVAGLLRVSVATVREWRYRGKIQVVQLPGGSLRVTQEELDRLVSGEAAPAWGARTTAAG